MPADNAVSALCKRCRLNNEPPVTKQHASDPPDGACPVCWSRYGRYVPVCRPAASLIAPKDEGAKK